jgi:exosortase E/protease (VPEID-CTERM system)
MTPVLPEPHPPAPGPGRLPLLRWAVLMSLLLAEAGALSFAYDAADRARDGGWAGAAIAWTPAVFRWALVAGGLAIVLGYAFVRDALMTALRAPHRPAGLAWAVVGNLVAYAVFALATARVMHKAGTLRPAELAAWLAAGGMTVGTWALAMVPARGWSVWARRGRWVLPSAGAGAALASLAARAARDEWVVLSQPAMRAAYSLARLVLPDVVYDPDARLLGTPRFWVEVGVPCSGYEGIGLMAVYLAVYLVLFRHGLRFPRAYLLVPLALSAVWGANVLRLVALVWIGDRVSPSLAIGGFHSQAGWVGFNVVALGLLIVAHRSRLFTKEEARRATGPNPTAAYLAPLLAALAVQMLVAAFNPRPELLYPLRALVAGLLLWYYWPRYTVLHSPGRGSSWTGLAWALAVGVGVFAVWVALVRETESFDAVADQSGWLAAGWVAARVVGFVIVTPLAEELAFRGYLMRWLISADFEAVRPGTFTWMSFLVSSVLFGLMHGEWVAGILAGAAYGLVVIRTGRVRDAVVAHAVTNGLLLVAAML